MTATKTTTDDDGFPFALSIMKEKQSPAQLRWKQF